MSKLRSPDFDFDQILKFSMTQSLILRVPGRGGGVGLTAHPCQPKKNVTCIISVTAKSKRINC